MNEDGTFSEYDDSELIDTLWNVNKNMRHTRQGSTPRINRYIMECKYFIIPPMRMLS